MTDASKSSSNWNERCRGDALHWHPVSCDGSPEAQLVHTEDSMTKTGARLRSQPQDLPTS